MTEALVLVVDASVVVKWHLRDEEFVDLALRVLQDYQDGRIDLLAPDHVRYEVPNAIRVAVSRSRLSFVEGTGAVNDFLNWRIPTINDERLIRRSWELTS